VGFSFDDEPTVNSKGELTVATSGCTSVAQGLPFGPAAFPAARVLAALQTQ